MNELTVKQKDVLRLILRSKTIKAPWGEDGWYRVSGPVWTIIQCVLPADLVEMRASEVGGYLRLTERGQIVGDYLA